MFALLVFADIFSPDFFLPKDALVLLTVGWRRNHKLALESLTSLVNDGGRHKITSVAET
jgi:hypothetical protein